MSRPHAQLVEHAPLKMVTTKTRRDRESAMGARLFHRFVADFSSALAKFPIGELLPVAVI
jgi:hypothetical protein